MRFTLAILATVLVYTWILQPRVPSSYEAVPVAIVLGLGVWHALKTRAWGFRVDALIPAFGAAALFTIPLVAIIVAAGAIRGTLHTRPEPLGDFLALIVWGGGQQWILQTIFLREARRVTSRGAGVVIAALLFAALHLPNPFLTAMTLIGALGWCAIYDRYPNVVPLALSHAAGTLAVRYAFDDAITARLRVGAAYWP